jgi:hypothetical protein
LLPLTVAAEDAESEKAWLLQLRGSGMYKEGLEAVHSKIDAAYDLGAIAGARRWEKIREYYIEVARSKGCKKGKPHAQGPVKACHRVSTQQPKIIGQAYKAGQAKIVAISRESLDPKTVHKILASIYDYGYVQGMKHGWRHYNDEMEWAETYYRSCITRATDSEHEPVCAKASRAWADAAIERLRKRVEAHGLPAGKKAD